MPLVHREFQSCLNFVSVFAVHIFYHRQSGTPTTTAGIPVKASTCQYSYMRRAIWKKGQNWTGWTVAGSLDSNKPGPVSNKTSVSKQGTLTALTALTAFTAWTALTTASVLRLWYQFQCSLWGRVHSDGPVARPWAGQMLRIAVTLTGFQNLVLDTHNIPQHHLITANICNNYFTMSWVFSKFTSMLCQQLQAPGCRCCWCKFHSFSQIVRRLLGT